MEMMNYDVLLIKMQLDCERNVNKEKLNDDMIALFPGEIDLKEIFSKETVSIDRLISLLTHQSKATDIKSMSFRFNSLIDLRLFLIRLISFKYRKKEV